LSHSNLLFSTRNGTTNTSALKVTLEAA